MTEKRPEIIEGYTARKRTPCGNMYITINRQENDISEMFATLGKAGTCSRAFLEGMGRVISLAIRKGVSEEDIAKTLMGIRCADSNSITGHSCLHTLSVAIKDVISLNNKKEDK